MQCHSNKKSPSLHRHLSPNLSRPHPPGHPPQESPQPAPDDAPALPVAEAPVVQTETSTEAQFSAGDSYISQCCLSLPMDVPPGCWRWKSKVSAHSILGGVYFLAIPPFEYGLSLGFDKCRLARPGVRPGTERDVLRNRCRWVLHGKSVEGSWRGADAVSWWRRHLDLPTECGEGQWVGRRLLMISIAFLL